MERCFLKSGIKMSSNFIELRRGDRNEGVDGGEFLEIENTASGKEHSFTPAQWPSISKNV